MRWQENTLYDFALVSTYVPVVMLILRSSIYLLAMHWLASFSLSVQGLTMVTASAVYIDSLLMRENNFDRACGHVCVCALAALTQLQAQEQCSNAQVLFVTCIDLLWSASAGVEVILRTTRAKVQTQQILKTSICCLIACVRVSLSCEALGFVNSLLRSFLYYVLCAMLLLCSAFLPQHERHLNVMSVVYISAHVLFVHLYAVIASMTVILAVHARLVYLHVVENTGDVHKTMENHESFSQSVSSAHAASNQAYTQNLLLKLQEAKRANNVP